MTSRMAPMEESPDRLELRDGPAPPGVLALLAALAGTVAMAAGVALWRLPHSALLLCGGAVMAAPQFLLRRGNTTLVIDRAAGRLTVRSPAGAIDREETLGEIEGVRCDHIALPAPAPGAPALILHRTLLHTKAGDVVVQGFGAAAPARELARRIERWLAQPQH